MRAGRRREASRKHFTTEEPEATEARIERYDATPMNSTFHVRRQQSRVLYDLQSTLRGLRVPRGKVL